MSATNFYKAGFTDLVSVIPPDGKLSPNSTIKMDARGKSPGMLGANGWYGYDWRSFDADPVKIEKSGANVGIRARHYPAVDIDCTDDHLAKIIEGLAIAQLGQAPCRIGRYPKRLLMYRTNEPFGRMRLLFRSDGKQHMLELLGDGQQYVVGGIHPVTNKPYEWTTPLENVSADNLPLIDKAKAKAFLDAVEEELDFLGLDMRREGDGSLSEAGPVVDQESLKAPSLTALAKAVACIPNEAETYDDYVQFGIAVKAAAGGDAGLDIFLEWCGRWIEGGNDPENAKRDWLRMRAPFRIGWEFIERLAREHGFNGAAEEFEATDEPEPEAEADTAGSGHRPLEYSDAAMASRLIAEHGFRLRYCEALGGWLNWDGQRWTKDETLHTLYLASVVLKAASEEAGKRPDFNATKADRIATALASNGTRSSVVNYAKADPRLAVKISQFDADDWALNTPSGVVNLRTGELRPRTESELLIKSAAVAPNFTSPPKTWFKFLKDTTNGDLELARYLKRFAGYCLTGSTIEQNLTFLHGGGGNGKSVFVGTIAGIMGDYASKAAMETFAASNSDRHPTELARLRGARLVYASETAGGRRWNESRIKELTGGEPITARFMHQDEFTYFPQFKLMFMGNHKPELRDIDEGLRRRFDLVPFVHKPAVPDVHLVEKLKAEWPGILAWMIEGCIEWQKDGLAQPAIVRAATAEYFSDEDSIGRWMNDKCIVEPQGFALSSDLFSDWRTWCGEAGEFAGSQKRFSTALRSRGFEKKRDNAGRQGFVGLSLKSEF